MILRTLRPLLLILALLLMQQVGTLHRYAHLPLGDAGSASWQSDHSELALEHPVGVHAGNLLPGHDTSLCGLLDHLCTGDALVPGFPALAGGLVVNAVIAWLGTRIFYASFSAFQARAPPVSSLSC